MAVLSNQALLAALDDGRLRIEPRPMPGPGEPDTPYNTSSVDLRLANEIRVPKVGLSLEFDLRAGNLAETIDTVYSLERIPDTGWTLPAHQFILGRTVEKVTLPIQSQLAARIEGRSSFARTGLLIHFTAPTIHANFEGTITLEMINLGPMPIKLTPNLRVCQLIVETVEGEPLPEDSQFQGQTTAAGN